MRNKIVFLLMTAILFLSGCETEIKPDNRDAGTYSTQNSMTSLEYSMFMNKQITVFANQLSSRMAVSNNGDHYENESILAGESLKVMEDALEEVVVTKPPSTSTDDREAVILSMETAIEHMEKYIHALNNPDEEEEGFINDFNDISKYPDIFKNDFDALTGLATLYYQ